MVHTETSRGERCTGAIVEAVPRSEEHASIARVSTPPRTSHEQTGHVFPDGGERNVRARAA